MVAPTGTRRTPSYQTRESDKGGDSRRVSTRIVKNGRWVSVRQHATGRVSASDASALGTMLPYTVRT